MTIVSIHQPGYLPWLGFFKKIMSCDIFVFLDDVQYEKRGWQNRNRIRTNTGTVLLTVPVKSKLGMNLNEVKINNQSNWTRKHKKSIEVSYSKTPHFNEYWNDFKKIYDRDFELLIELNMKIIYYIMEKLNIRTKTIFSSELHISEKSSNRILEICKALNCYEYLSGSQGKSYLNEADFVKNNISVKFQNFHHPVYRQIYEPFISNMAIIDLLFNEGRDSVEILDRAQNF